MLQDGDEWERVQFAVKERAAGSKEHHDVTEEEQVRVGPYMLCTKCAGFNTKPQRSLVNLKKLLNCFSFFFNFRLLYSTEVINYF